MIEDIVIPAWFRWTIQGLIVVVWLFILTAIVYEISERQRFNQERQRQEREYRKNTDRINQVNKEMGK